VSCVERALASCDESQHSDSSFPALVTFGRSGCKTYPNVHLVTASADIAEVCNAVDPRVVGTLRIAIARTVCGAGWVEVASAARTVHSRKVKSAVHTAGQVGDVNGKLPSMDDGVSDRFERVRMLSVCSR